MQSNNIVVFPKINKNAKDVEAFVEQVEENLDLVKNYHIQETINNIVPNLFYQLEIAGFTMDDENIDDIKDDAFIVESIRSLLCSYYDIYHPFQKLSGKIFYPDEKEANTLKIVDDLSINFKKEAAE